MRRGFAVLEVVVSCGLLAVLLTLTVQLLMLVAAERKDLDRRAIALQEAANLVERVSAFPFDELDAKQLGKLDISPGAAALLPEHNVTFDVADAEGPLPGKRVRVEIAWRGRNERAQRPVQLTQWFWQPAGELAR